MNFSTKKQTLDAVVGQNVVSTTGPYGVHDTMRNGLLSVASELAPNHPLKSTLKTVEELASERRNSLYHTMEQRIMRESHRLSSCAVASCSIGLSIVNGAEDTIDFCDFLNVPGAAPNMPHQ